jgi:hypothetical protein
MEEVNTNNNNLIKKRANNPIYQASHFIAEQGKKLEERAKRNPYGVLEVDTDTNK